MRKANAAHADYDAHKADGMAAQVTKTFNRKSSFGSMGTSKRFADAFAKERAPGPGHYVIELERADLY